MEITTVKREHMLDGLPLRNIHERCVRKLKRLIFVSGKDCIDALNVGRVQLHKLQEATVT